MLSPRQISTHTVIHVLLRWLFACAVFAVAAVHAESPASVALPAFSRAWNGADYKLISDAIASRSIALPRYAALVGAQILRKIASADNLAYQANPFIPTQVRLQDFVTMQQAAGAMTMAYYSAANSGQDVHAEMATMLAVLLRTSASGASILKKELADEMRGEAGAGRAEALKKVRAGLTSVLLGAETSLSERTFYDASDISVMLAALADSVEPMKTFLSADVQEELHRKFAAHGKVLSKPADLDNLRRIVAALRA